MCTRQVSAASSSWTADLPPEEVLYGALTKLQQLRREQPTAAAYIERWCTYREETIELTPELLKTLETICQRFNTARQVGATASVSGIICAVVGVILKIKGIPVGDKFVDGGKYLAAGGGVVLTGSNLLEACLTHSRTNDIKQRIQKDLEMTRPIRQWVEFSHEVEVCFNRLLQCNIASPDSLKVLELYQHCCTLIEAGTHEIGDLIRDLRDGRVNGMTNVTLNDCTSVIAFLVRIQENPKIRVPLKRICEIVTSTPGLIQFVKIGIGIYTQTYGVMPCLPFNFSSTNVWHCALEGIKMLFDLVTSVNLEEIERRQAEYFKALENVIEALKSELDQVKNYLNTPVVGYETLAQELTDLRL